ncbi:MAG: CinA family protein [Rickettsiales bacterium]
MSPFSAELQRHAEVLLQSLRGRNLKLTTAESCTGGLLSALLTEIPGSSDVLTHGYITYANAAKTAMVGVKESLLKSKGAVSEEVAIAMAEGALKASGAQVSISITGIAGPGGATKDKQVGLVHLATARTGFKPLHSEQHFSGDRSSIRLQAVAAAMELIGCQLNR